MIKKCNLVVFIDLKKEFDTVNHDIRLKKLEFYGIKGQALGLLKSYLSNRHQNCQIENFVCVGPTTKSENLWRKLNSGHGLVSMDADTFRAAFVGCRTEQVFWRTHLISSTVCVGHPGSEPEQCLCEIENLALPSHFFLSSPYKWCT